MVLRISKLSLVAIGLAVILGGVVFYLRAIKTPSDCSQLTTSLQPTHSIRITGGDLDAIQKVVLSNDTVRQTWQAKIALVSPPNTLSAWLTEVRALPNKNAGATLNPIQASINTPLQVYLLIRSGWKTPHQLRLIFLLDYAQLAVLTTDDASHFYDLPILEPGQEAALEFELPTLSPGFHQLSLLLITDPQKSIEEGLERELQRSSFTEARYDIWVGEDEWSKSMPSFDSLAAGSEAASRLQVVELWKPTSGTAGEPFATQSMKTGEERCFNLRLLHAQPDTPLQYEGSLPVRALVFWDDEVRQELNFDLGADTPQNYILPVKLRAPNQPGPHSLFIVVFAPIGYSQFAPNGERVGAPAVAFTSRVQIDTQP